MTTGVDTTGHRGRPRGMALLIEQLERRLDLPVDRTDGPQADGSEADDGR